MQDQKTITKYELGGEKMSRILGFDIGGANTKAVSIVTQKGRIASFKVLLRHFPFWKHNSRDLSNLLIDMDKQLNGSKNLDGVAVTMTAELSDVYTTKQQGINDILDCVSNVFLGTDIAVLDVDQNLVSISEAKNNPLKVASANWTATGWLVSRKVNECIVIDVGSTSTSIIPIFNGKVAAWGKTDLEKLMIGELVYTGSLRTNVAAIVQEVPVRNGIASVSSEFFVQSGDVHLLLGNIKTEDYTVETPDGKGISHNDVLSRLAHLLCADTNMLSERELTKIANFIYHKQLDQITKSAKEVVKKHKQKNKNKIPAVVTGFGQEFLAAKAARKAGIKEVIYLDSILPKSAVVASPAAGVAIMAANKLEGGQLDWTL
jgi:probable H4MPT-linked C1 transfer pathway protein